MLGTSLMRSGDILNYLMKKYHAEPAVEPNRKIIPLVGAVGNFDYDVLRDTIKCDEINRLLVGLESSVYCYADILEKVEGKTRFMEQTIGYSGGEMIVESSPISLNNGNVIDATYHMIFQKDMGLVRITGKSQLIKVA